MECPCIHHWIIETASGNPNGSTGTCKKCKVSQVFYNSIPETRYLYNTSKKDKEQS